MEQLQSLTFGERREVISSIKGVHAVSNMLEQFPFFEELEKVLLWELELVVSKLMNVRVPYEVFIARWKRLATCFVDMTENRSDDSTALDALKKIHEPFSPMGPLLLTLSDGQKMESFLKNVPSKSPYLVYTGADKSTGSEEQIFLIIDEDVLLECTQVSKDHCLFTSSLLTLMAIYYSCNLQYEDDRKHLFKFLEEHILGIIPKRKPYILKQLENKLLSKMNKALPGSMNAVN